MNRKLVFGRVAGVMSATMMLVLVGCSTTRYERSTGEYVDDQMLNRRVRSALAGQPVYKFPDVHVHSYRGIVQVTGFVATDQQKQAAAEIASRVRGVGQVENGITVAPLEADTLRDFIPGREMNGTNEVRAIGRPAPIVTMERGSGSSEDVRFRDANTNSVQSGSSTNVIQVR